jgi:hypothetical protein
MRPPICEVSLVDKAGRRIVRHDRARGFQDIAPHGVVGGVDHAVLVVVAGQPFGDGQHAGHEQIRSVPHEANVERGHEARRHPAAVLSSRNICIPVVDAVSCAPLEPRSAIPPSCEEKSN